MTSRDGDLARRLARAGITEREAEVLSAVAARLRNREIADRLHISIRTVESHIAALLRKLAVTDRAALVEAGAQLGASTLVRPTLPIPLTSFVGRARETTEISALLDRNRLVTLIGPAGAGKTRLALHVAAAGADRFPDGSRQADLAPVAPELVADTLARAVGIIPQPSRPARDSLCDAAREAGCLLLVDNCEHVIAEAATLVTDLLTAGSQLRVLATSREPLGVPGEVSYQVPPLPVPVLRASPRAATAGRYDAVRLFVDRAASVSPGFALTDANAAAVTVLCQRLDGLPLPIELAASRVRSFPPAAMVAHLDQRFELLSGGARTALPRHRTLRAAIDWSYHLLDEPERAMFDQLAVFPADFDYEAVAATCAWTDDRVGAVRLLPALVDKSLVSTSGGDTNRRYRLLESVRAYAAERLAARGADANATRDRHRDWCLALAERAAPHLRGPEQAAWLARLDQEHDNVRAALAWSVDQPDAGPGLRLATAMWWFWHIRGFFGEGRRWLEQLLAAAPDAPDALRAPALRALGVLALRGGDDRTAVAALTDSRALFRALGDRLGMAKALTGLQMIAFRRGDYRQATALGDECLALSRRLGDSLMIANSLNNLALVAREQGRYAQGTAMWEECLGIYRAQGNVQGLAMALGNLGQLAAEQDDYPLATARHAESLALGESVGDSRTITFELARGAALEAVQGRYAIADRLLESCLEVARDAGDRQRIGYARCGQAEVAYLRGDGERAMALYDDVLATFRELDEKLGLATASLGVALTAASTGEVRRAAAAGDESLALYHQLGHRKGAAWSQHALARAARLMGDEARAADLDHQALAACRALASWRGVAHCLEGLAQHATATNQAVRAVLRWAAASKLRDTIGAPLPPVDRSTSDTEIAKLRADLGDETFTATWRDGRTTAAQQVTEASARGHPGPTGFAALTLDAGHRR